VKLIGVDRRWLYVDQPGIESWTLSGSGENKRSAKQRADCRRYPKESDIKRPDPKIKKIATD
jgi:hypothetical protein